MSDYPTRPQTPQAMLHRLPDKPDPSSDDNRRPSKYIILITASTAVAGKVQIATAVSDALSCPLFQGDSMHETAAKAASVGASANEARYQRMWLSKMTRTGHLFPDSSRAASEGFSGFGGTSSSSTCRRGSVSSVASEASSTASTFDAPTITTKYINKPPVLYLSAEKMSRKANPALMVVTHPELEQWHRETIRQAVVDYGIGVIFIPLSVDEKELPVLKPLNPRTMSSFPSFGAAKRVALDEEIELRVDVEANVEEIGEEIIEGVRGIMYA